MVTVITIIVLVDLEDQMETKTSQDSAEAKGMEANYTRLRQYTLGKSARKSHLCCAGIFQVLRTRDGKVLGLLARTKFLKFQHYPASEPGDTLKCLADCQYTFFFFQINSCTQQVSTLTKLKPPLQRDMGKELGVCFTIKTS